MNGSARGEVDFPNGEIASQSRDAQFAQTSHRFAER